MSSKTVIIVHGTMGKPEGNWFPWLKRELEKLGVKAIVPRFPTPDGQNLASWLAVLDKYQEDFDENLILVGHSIGPSLILQKLQRLNKPICAAILISGWQGMTGLQEYDELNETFFKGPFNWEKIKANAGKIVMFHGADDPYVPLAMAKELASKLDVKLNVIEKGGHLNAETGYLKFPEVLETIKGLL